MNRKKNIFSFETDIQMTISKLSEDDKEEMLDVIENQGMHTEALSKRDNKKKNRR